MAAIFGLDSGGHLTQSIHRTYDQYKLIIPIALSFAARTRIPMSVTLRDRPGFENDSRRRLLYPE